MSRYRCELVLAVSVLVLCSLWSRTETPGVFELRLTQDRQTRVVKDGSHQVLERRPFTFSFELQETRPGVEAPVCLAGDVLPPPRVEAGQRLESIPSFEPGRALAVEGPRAPFYLSWDCHRYLFYDPRAAGQSPVGVLRPLGGGWNEVYWTVDSLWTWSLEDEPTRIEPELLPSLHVMAVADRNRNGRVDEGELVRFTIAWR